MKYNTKYLIKLLLIKNTAKRAYTYVALYRIENLNDILILSPFEKILSYDITCFYNLTNLT